MEKMIIRQTGSDMKYRQWHTNDENMLMYVHRGEGAVVCGDGTYKISEGILIFIGARKYHYTVPELPETYERSKIFIPSENFKQVLSGLSAPHWKNTFTADSFVYAIIPYSERKTVESLYEEIEKYGENEDYNSIIFTSCVLKLIFYLHKNIIDNISPSYGQIYNALSYINENIFENITINSICNAVHMSKYHFCRIFKKHTGQTVMNYILKTRIILAQTMLRNENLTISEISSRCGFSSISYFCRVFKEETGLSPLKYKKFHEKKGTE